jgi:heme-degrading monooxygenase HmoA
MILAMTARRVTAGKADEFIDKFAGDKPMPDQVRENFEAIYACVDTKDPDVVLTLGMFKGTPEMFAELQGSGEREERLGGVESLIEEVVFDRSFEVQRDFVAEASS